jgi:hypothetical protein
MPPAGFESAIPASERPQTHALDLAATGIGTFSSIIIIIIITTTLYRPCRPTVVARVTEQPEVRRPAEAIYFRFSKRSVVALGPKQLPVQCVP